MNYRLLLFLLCLSGTQTACTQKRVTGVSASTSTVQAAAPEITGLKMERTPCFGRCPSYTLEIYAGGQVRYSGYRFTDHIGVYEKQADSAETRDLLRQFSALRPDTCQEHYELHIADLPGINYTIYYAGDSSKTITNAHFGPDVLRGYAGRLDSRFPVGDDWKKTADTAIRR